MKSQFLLCLLLAGSFDFSNAQEYKEKYAEFVSLNKDSAYSLLQLADKMNFYLQGSNAPQFTAQSTENKEINLSKFKGNTLVLNFWNTKCESCLKELPQLNRMAEELERNKVVFIFLLTENEKEVMEFFKRESMKFITIPNSGSVAEEFYLPKIYPYTIIIDQSGKIKKMWFANRWDESVSNVIREINEIL
ncbi:MAG: TlpA family protein disulfide reductase [Flavisolibacter sp.]|nr:TlpA family protein disulfide reductase [Flavisolibacter sp.]